MDTSELDVALGIRRKLLEGWARPGEIADEARAGELNELAGRALEARAAIGETAAAADEPADPLAARIEAASVPLPAVE